MTDNTPHPRAGQVYQFNNARAKVIGFTDEDVSWQVGAKRPFIRRRAGTLSSTPRSRMENADMPKEILNVGDRLISITTHDGATYNATKAGIISIGVDRLPGPMGFYLVAYVLPEEGPDIIVPLHTANEFRVSNP